MIDISPEALAALKARPATVHRLFEGDFVVALIDALEAARAELAKRPSIMLGGQHALIQGGQLAQNAALQGKPAP